MLTINVKWCRAMYAALCLYWVSDYIIPNGYNTSFRYVILVAVVLVMALFLYCTRDGRTFETGVISRMNIMFGVFLLVSLVSMFFNGFEFFAMRDVFQFYMPALLAFLIYNAEPGENMDFYFDVLMICETFAYLYFFRAKLSPANFLSINLLDSYSPFESVIASRFTVLFVYYYMRKRTFPCAAAFILNYMSLKRFNVAYAVFILMFGWLLKKIKLRGAYIAVFQAVFILSPYLLMLACTETFINWFDATFSKTFFEFTSARSSQFSYILARTREYSLYGLGAVENFTSNTHWVPYFHSDLLRYCLETTVAGLFAMVTGLFGMVRIRRDIISFSLVVFMMVTMLVSILIGDFLALFAIFLLLHVDMDAVNASSPAGGLKKIRGYSKKGMITGNV